MSESNEQKKKRLKLQKAKLENLALVRAMKTDSDWTRLEEILQEVMATYVIKDPDKKMPAVKKLKADLISEINLRYDSDHETRDILLGAIPSDVTMGKWIRKPKWNEAVWGTIKETGLFTKEKRSKLINALYQRGLDKSDNAAKIFLTLSGDYSDKLDIAGDKTVEKFREINEILHKKSKE